MRYALRNQDKIAAVFDEDYLKNHIIQSLDRFFANNDNDCFIKSVELDTYQAESGESYAVLRVNDIAQCYESLGMNPEIALNDRDGIGFYTKTKFAPGWKNKMFVRADLMPHHIRITNIKIERLQNISDEDCFKEGIFKWDAGQKDIPFYSFHNADIPDYNDPRDAFAALIDKVSGKGTWESNPYVFVYEFELIK